MGNLTGKDFVSYITGIALLIDPITHTTTNYNSFKEGQASVDKIFELLAIEPAVSEAEKAIALQAVTGKS